MAFFLYCSKKQNKTKNGWCPWWPCTSSAWLPVNFCIKQGGDELFSRQRFCSIPATSGDSSSYLSSKTIRFLVLSGLKEMEKVPKWFQGKLLKSNNSLETNAPHAWLEQWVWARWWIKINEAIIQGHYQLFWGDVDLLWWQKLA